jgi:maleamate amidohydrolase
MPRSGCQWSGFPGPRLRLASLDVPTTCSPGQTGAEWRNAIPAEDWETYRLAGLGVPEPPGSRPALLVIDTQYRTLGERPLPLRDAISQSYPTSCGEAGWRALPAIAQLISAARANRVPIVYPFIPRRSGIEAGRMGRRAPGLLAADAHGYEFPPSIQPEQTDLVMPKFHASAFMGTPLLNFLIDLGVDTVILTGCTTSGCVRATAVDASGYNFRCVVAEDAVYDRAWLTHCVNLFDIQAKYGEVMAAASIGEYLSKPSPGMS